MPDTGDRTTVDEFIVNGQLLRDGHGQASFRIAAAPCGSCRSCHASSTGDRVRDIVIESAVVLHGAIGDLATQEPVQACLLGSRRACRRAASLLYGLPLAGMVLGVLAMDQMTGTSAVRELQVLGAALMGMFTGAAVARALAAVPEVTLRMDAGAAADLPLTPDDSGRPQ